MSNDALTPDDESSPKQGFLSRIGFGGKRRMRQLPDVKRAEEITQTLEVEYGLGGTSIAAVMGSGRREIRDRTTIYKVWQDMESDPIISTALGLLVSAALGGHETNGQLVFIETNDALVNDKQAQRYAQEIAGDLTEIFNSIAREVCYTGAWGGDAYTRIYSQRGKGVIGLHWDELYLPPLVQAYEQAGRTVGFTVNSGRDNWERLNVIQMARLKMPRSQYVPQHTVLNKALKSAIEIDDRDALPVMPSLVGGSLLYPCEGPYNDLYASLLGLVGSRLSDSIDEEIYGANMAQMTDPQQRQFMDKLIGMFRASKARAMDAVEKGRPVVERIRHIIPVNGEKQLVQLNGGNQPRANAINIEDVMFHAKRLSGALGVDLTMIGFADQMHGGLGEGGFFRTSAHVGERARVLRTALSDYFDSVINVHTLQKYGIVFPEKTRPWKINFWGTISALESERVKTKMEAMNAGSILGQIFDSLKNTGLSENAIFTFLSKQVGIDEQEARLYAADIAKAAAKGQDDMGGGF